MQVRQSLNGIGEGLVVDLRVFAPGCGRGWRR